MKIKWKTIGNLLSALGFLAGLVVLLAALTHVTRNKNEADIVYPYYYEAENSLDVVFVGSSHIMCGVLPLELYRDYGITSYDYASSALVLPQSYYQVVEALKTQTPEVLVLDVTGAVYGDTKVGSAEYVHTQLDNMKWSWNKVRAIEDLIENPDDRAEYYFPLIRFHTRWKELEDRDYQRIAGGSKGARLDDHVMTDVTPPELAPRDYVVPMSDYAETYLRRTLDYCQEREIPVVLLNTPYLANRTLQGNCNAVDAVAAEYGVPYLNLFYHLDELGFDWTSDLRDEWHCNLSGARKVTAFLGRYLKEHYEIPDRRGDPDWDEACQRYPADG